MGRALLVSLAGRPAPWYNSGAMGPSFRRATVRDVPHIQRLITHYAAREEMLPRSLNEIYEGLRDYLVAEQEGRVIGCAACSNGLM